MIIHLTNQPFEELAELPPGGTNFKRIDSFSIETLAKYFVFFSYWCAISKSCDVIFIRSISIRYFYQQPSSANVFLRLRTCRWSLYGLFLTIPSLYFSIEKCRGSVLNDLMTLDLTTYPFTCPSFLLFPKSLCLRQA